jgi:hypothetical protein
VSAKVLTWGIGLLYLVLGAYGWFTPGFLLHTPFAIPMGVADNVFHLFLSIPAMVIVVLDLRTFLTDRGIKTEHVRLRDRLLR